MGLIKAHVQVGFMSGLVVLRSGKRTIEETVTPQTVNVRLP